MKKVYLLLLSVSFFFHTVVYSQEQPQYDNAADSIYLKCLYEEKNFFSTNLLQFVVGTANINYERMLTAQYSLKIGAGTSMGYRILVDDYENTLPGGYYFLVEPRWYTFQSTKNCWMNLGFSAGYKYWSYVKNELIPSQNSSDIDDYQKIDIIQHQGFFSAFGKHPITGGFTFEYQAGIGAGVKNNEFHVSPNFGFSIGWIF